MKICIKCKKPKPKDREGFGCWACDGIEEENHNHSIWCLNSEYCEG